MVAAVAMVPRTAMSMDELKKKCPSAFGTKPSSKMSDRYTFIPTHQIVAALEKMGLVPVEASQRRSTEAATARHLLRFARKVDIDVKGRKVGDVIPEVITSSSHNGRAAFKLYFGLFRFVCGNGLIVADNQYAGMVRRHIGNVAAVMDEAAEILSHTKDVMNRVGDMQKVKLTDAARNQFANDALALRYADDDGKVAAPITATDLLVPRRDVDAGNDLWHTYNVIQENLMRGGLEGKSAQGRIVHTREVKDVRKVLTFNTELWSLAAQRLPGAKQAVKVAA